MTRAADEVMRERAQRLYRLVFAVRFFASLLGVLAMTALVELSDSPEQTVAIAAVMAVATLHHTASFFYARRRALTDGGALANVGLSIALGLVGIALTGGVESPVIVVFIGLVPVLGFVFGHTRAAWTLAALVIVGLWVSFGGVALGLLPRVSLSAYGLGEGFATATPYVWLKLAFMTLAVLLLGLIGALARRAMDGLERASVNARERTLDALGRRNGELVSIASTVAHELRNPLASIRGLAQLVLRDAADPKLAERVGVVAREAERMTAVLDAFRSFRLPLSELELQPVDLRALTREACALHEALAGERDVALVLADGAPLTTVGDPHKLLQALVNLVRNALQAAPAGSRVSVTAARVGDGVEVAIEDAGPGFPALLVREGPTLGRTTKPDGTGLGLVLARAIADQHGGALRLEARLGGGARAVLALPDRLWLASTPIAPPTPAASDLEVSA